MTQKRLESSVLAKQVVKKDQRTRKRYRKNIDFSDIQELSDDQLSSMRRVGRPPLGEQVRQLIAIRVDVNVLIRLQAEAKTQRKGYQTLINEILAEHVEENG